MDELELELKTLIVEALKLEDIKPEEIDSNEALFGEGLALDSIDALELGVALRKRYEIQIAVVDEDIKIHFSTVGHLARFIESQKQKNQENSNA